MPSHPDHQLEDMRLTYEDEAREEVKRKAEEKAWVQDAKHLIEFAKEEVAAAALVSTQKEREMKNENERLRKENTRLQENLNNARLQMNPNSNKSTCTNNSNHPFISSGLYVAAAAAAASVDIGPMAAEAAEAGHVTTE